MLCISNNSVKHQSFIYAQLDDQTVIFPKIQFNKSRLFTLSLNVAQSYLTLSVAATESQNGPWSNGNEGAVHIPQISSFTGVSQSDCFLQLQLTGFKIVM